MQSFAMLLLFFNSFYSHKGIELSYDAGWQTRIGRKSYNSLLGNYAKKTE